MHSALAAETEQSRPAPLNGGQLNRLQQAIADLSAQQLNWASGYLAGLSCSRVTPGASSSKPPVTVLYASQTGNSRTLAETLCRAAEAQGVPTALHSADRYKPRELGKEKALILIVSTHGEGEPPESARSLQQYLSGPRAPQLNGLKFAVFGLGDSSYEQFCAAARLFDQQLATLGGERLMPLVEADVDFQTPGDLWIPQILARVEPLQSEQSGHLATISPIRPLPRIDRNHPYAATLVESRRITTDDAVGEVHHLALQVDPELVRYQPGDALGVWFHNDPLLIDEVLQRTGLRGESETTLKGERITLQQALGRQLELTQLHPAVVRRWAESVESETLRELTADPALLRDYCRTRQLVDLLNDYPRQIGAGDLVALLQPLQPRLYSIASSQQEHEEEIHLTVGVHRYRAQGREHLGGASGFLGERLREGSRVEIYVVENAAFRLPENGDTPVIMIGAGTGIAPFRAFLQQRAAAGAKGHNWLIFGNRHFHRDFLYQQEWLAYRSAGQLQRVTPAFSRDGAADAYVQDRLLEQGEEICRWLKQGAHIYVCGAIAMEAGVRQALTEVVAQHSGHPTSDAGEFIDRLQQEGRYQRDVY
jgi:sulfite reductase (NADPH) flavoprotein alpha-component